MPPISDWTYDSSTELGKLREKISDIDHGKPIFSDTELSNILDAKRSDLDLAAAEALSRLLMRPALLKRLFDATSLDNYSQWASVINQRIESFLEDGGTSDNTQVWDERHDSDIYQDVVRRTKL
jgi:hypothetical protein